MTAALLPQVQDSLRGVGLSSTASLEVSLLVLAWAKLSLAQAIPSELRLSAVLLEDPRQIQSILASLGGINDGEYRVFSELQPVVSGSPGLFLPAVQLVLGLMKAGLIAGLDVTDVLDSASGIPHQESLLPREIAALLVELSLAQAGESVYLPWDSMGQLAAFAARTGAEAYVETPFRSPTAELIALLSKNRFEVHQADPVRAPSSVEHGRPRKFELAIAFPPIGMRYDGGVTERDWFGRFPERTASGAILAVRQLLWQAKRRVVVAIPNSLLFSTGVELELRRDLIERGLVETVVGMRPGLLTHTNLPFSILILDPRGDHSHVNFINADSERFAEPISKARFRLVDLLGLVELVRFPVDSRFSKTVPVNELGPDAQLQVNRYVIPETTKQLLSMISTVETVSLGDLVQTVRPMLSKPSPIKDPIEAREVGAADIPPFGYIQDPSRSVKIDGAMAEKNKNQFLLPLDIVLVVKGSVGKVGIVSPNAPEPGPGGWVAGQSTIVLRAKHKAIVEPRTLALQLRSELGQSLLSGIVSGAVIPLIQLRELMLLPVLLPAIEEQRRAAEALDREAAMQEEIDRLRHVQSEIAADLWALTSIKPVTVSGGAASPTPDSAPRIPKFLAEKSGRKFREE
jgi:type I restriction enzyme M protein